MFFSLKENFIFTVLKRHKLSIFYLLLGSAALAGVAVASPYVLKILVDTLAGENPQTFFSGFSQNTSLLIVALVGCYAFVEFFSQLLNVILRLLRQKFDFFLTLTSEKILFDKLQTLDAGFLENPKNKNLVRSFFRIKDLISDFLNFVSTNLQKFFTLLGIFPVVMLVDFRIFFILLFFSLIQTWVILKRIPVINSQRTQTDYVSSKMYSTRWTLFEKFHQLLSLSGTSNFLDKYFALQKKIQNLEYPIEKKRGIWQIGDWLLDNVPRWLVMIFVAFKIQQGTLSIGDFTLVLLYTQNVQDIFATIPRTLGDWSDFFLGYTRTQFFFHLEPKYRLLEPQFKGPFSGDIVFKNLSFFYPTFSETEAYILQKVIIKNKQHADKKEHWRFDSDEVKGWETMLEEGVKEPKKVLSQVNMVWKKGGITALVGRNGAGKTTCTKLVLKNYSPSKGAVWFGNTNLDYVDPGLMRNHISIITQEPVFLESFSLRENLLLGVTKKITNDQIEKVLRRLRVFDVVERSDKGLHAVIGDDLLCSAGQVQLFTIARALFQDRPVLIFDEGTNQLDPEHESIIIKILQEEKKRGKTVCIISHKITTAAKADYIYVLDKCGITEEGGHEALLKNNGLYKKFWELQVGNNSLEDV